MKKIKRTTKSYTSHSDRYNKNYETSVLDMNTIVQPYNQYGEAKGLFDPLASTLPSDLIGTPENPGWLIQMRIGHPLITSILDSRKSLIESTKFSFTGVNSKKLNDFFRDKVYFKDRNNSLSSWIAYIIDNSTSYGFCLTEHIWGSSDLYLYDVDPRTVYEFETDDEDRSELTSIKFLDGMSYYSVPIERFVLFNREAIKGNFWGLSELRSLVQRFVALQSDYKSYVAKSAISKGIIYASTTTDNGGITDTGKANIANFLTRVYQGQDTSVILEPDMKLEILSSPNSNVVTDFQASNDGFDEQVRQVLNSNLNTLGLSSVGSKALGETIQVSDEEKFEAYLESWLTKIVNSDLIKNICVDLGIRHEGIGLSTTNQTKTENKLNIDQIILFIEKGIVTPQQLGKDNIINMLGATGLDINKLDLNEDSMDDNYDNIPVPELIDSIE